MTRQWINPPSPRTNRPAPRTSRSRKGQNWAPSAIQETPAIEDNSVWQQLLSTKLGLKKEMRCGTSSLLDEKKCKKILIWWTLSRRETTSSFIPNPTTNQLSTDWIRPGKESMSLQKIGWATSRRPLLLKIPEWATSTRNPISFWPSEAQTDNICRTITKSCWRTLSCILLAHVLRLTSCRHTSLDSHLVDSYLIDTHLVGSHCADKCTQASLSVVVPAAIWEACTCAQLYNPPTFEYVD